GLALGSALLLARRRSARQEDEIASMAERLISVTRDLPMPILRLDGAGAIREALGAPMPWGGGATSFAAMADDPQTLTEALAKARTEGAAEVAFAPAGAADQWVV